MNIPPDLLRQTTEGIREFVLRSLPYDRKDQPVAAHLRSMDATELLATWFNWSSRKITAHPRRVHLSREFLANPLRPRYRGALDQLLADIAHGADLNRYLSRSIAVVATPSAPGRRGRRRELDLMLNAWGIYHLHMGRNLDADGFVTRSEHLLFAAFYRGHAFMLDIMPHSGAWARQSTIRIIVENWPHLSLVHRMNGVTGLSDKGDDAQCLAFMPAYANVPVEIDGAVYMPSMGITAAGFSVEAVRSADFVMGTVEAFVDRVLSEPDFLPDLLTSYGVSISDQLRFEFTMDEAGFGVIESTSGVQIRLFNEPASEVVRRAS